MFGSSRTLATQPASQPTTKTLKHQRLATLLMVGPLALALACESQTSAGDQEPVGPSGKSDDLGSNAEPGTRSLACWDGTFAYNTLTIREVDDELEVRLAGAQMDIAEFLVADGAFPWAPADVTFSLPTDQCSFSSADDRLLGCQSSGATQVVIAAQPGSSVEGVEAEIHVSLVSTHVTRLFPDGTTKTGVDLEVRTFTDADVGEFTFHFDDALGSGFPEAGCSTDPNATVP